MDCDLVQEDTQDIQHRMRETNRTTEVGVQVGGQNVKNHTMRGQARGGIKEVPLPRGNKPLSILL